MKNPTVPKLQSGFALLDVKSGRASLAKTVVTHQIPVTIKGYINSQWGNDDGTSIEFEVLVSSVSTGKPKMKK